MDQDIKIKRAIFIERSVEIRETFSFALPEQVLRAVQIYCLHLYGGMLWEFDSDKTGEFCRAWRTCVKLVYAVPRSTKTFIVDHYLAANFDPVLKELFSRYVKFVKSLRNSASIEVQALFNIVKKDIQSNTGKNIHVIQTETGLNPLKITSRTMRDHKMINEIPPMDVWRIPLLDKLLKQRRDLETQMMNTGEVEHLINGVCCT